MVAHFGYTYHRSFVFPSSSFSSANPTTMQALLVSQNFQHMLRVLNTNLDGKVKIVFALTSIRGVGRRYATLGMSHLRARVPRSFAALLFFTKCIWKRVIVIAPRRRYRRRWKGRESAGWIAGAEAGRTTEGAHYAKGGSPRKRGRCRSPYSREGRGHGYAPLLEEEEGNPAELPLRGREGPALGEGRGGGGWKTCCIAA